MAQRFSGRVRQKAEWYPTPAWVTRALFPVLGSARRTVWEPACGEGHMSRVLADRFSVVASDIRGDMGRFGSVDFLAKGLVPPTDFQDIVTNPPYGLGGRDAVKFIERALEMTQPQRGRVAMLLKADFDSGSTRTHLFRDCPAFAARVVLLDRIIWFDKGDGQTPSENHIWAVWDWRHCGPARVIYAKRRTEIEREAGIHEQRAGTDRAKVGSDERTVIA